MQYNTIQSQQLQEMVKVAANDFRCLVNRGTMGVNSLPQTCRLRRGCDLNPGPSAPESSTLTSRLLSHPILFIEGTETAHTGPSCVLDAV